MRNVEKYRDLLVEISKVSKTSVNHKEALNILIDTILNKILTGNELKSVLYIALPIWSYVNSKWEDEYPTWFKSNDIKDSYYNFFTYVTAHLDFSFVSFISTKLKNIPLFIDINFSEEYYTYQTSLNSNNSDSVRVRFFRKQYKDHNEIKCIDYNDSDYIEFSKQLTSLVIDNQEDQILLLYKFLCIYNLYFEEIQTITLIPSVLYKQLDSSVDAGYGGALLILNEDILEETKRLISILLSIKYKELAVVDWIQNSVQCLTKESIKSAVAAIMTRNMSHNLGSHYLYYTKTHLEKLAKLGGNLGPDLRGASKVLGYMQARMDYLATVISNDRYPYGGVNFKSQIFDELTIDDFSKRHFKDNINTFREEDKNIIWYNINSEKIQEVYNKAHEIDKNSRNIDEYKKNVRSYLEGLSSIRHDIDVILGDGKTNRTTNFLLSNLIKSENFTRSDIMDSFDAPCDRNLLLRVLYKGEGDDSFLEFTGSADAIKDENYVKHKLSRMSFALPGGVMSCHAFFNVIENFIRNSAKYMQGSLNNKDLVVTIAIEHKIVDDIDSYEFTIFDNKQNAYENVITDKGKEKRTASLVETIKCKLGSLKILDEKNKIEKNNKGFKEMLFSTIWMRSYKFIGEENNLSNTTYSDILTNIHSAADGKEKLDLISNYAFEILAVCERESENGKELDINLNDRCDDSQKYNFGIKFTLPEYKHSITFDYDDNESSIRNACLKNFGEIVEVNGENVLKAVRNYFPRIILKDDSLTNTEKLHKILHQRFGDEIDKYVLSFDQDKERDGIVDDKYKIYMERHLSTKEGNNHFAKFGDYAYADSVSGGNFTITLNEWFKKWYDSGRDIQAEEYYNVLKIKEAALTKITIIDERLWDDMNKYGDLKSNELALKNIRILNYIENKENHKAGDLMSIFKGNTFNDKCDETHFLSIHLGLIEKIVKEAPMFNAANMSIDQRTELFMRYLKQTFGENAYISVHSGRGNFSAELEKSLRDYPFIGMAALENAYNNSKYLLAQLFYSTVYYGKGALN